MGSVSHSEVDSYLLCRRKHYYGYGLSLQRQSTGAGLSKGTAGHAILEVFYKEILRLGGNSAEGQREAFDSALEAAEYAYDDIEKAGETGDDDKHAPLYDLLFTYYFPNEPFVLSGWRIMAVEKEFNLEYNPETQSRYPFVVDLIARDPDGQTVVIDHKFVFDFYGYREAEIQPQIPKYIGALRALNFKIDYGYYNMLRTRKQKLMSKETQMRGLALKPSPTRVKTTFMEQIGVASEVEQRKLLPLEAQSQSAYRTANKMVCQGCSYFNLCTVELAGGNVEMMIEMDYKKRERRVFKEVSEENV